MSVDFDAVKRALAEDDLQIGGQIVRVAGHAIEAVLPRARTGAVYRIPGHGGRPDLLAEVIGFRDKETILAPFGDARGIGPGELVLPEGTSDRAKLSDGFLGRIVDALGNPLDGCPPVLGRHLVPLYRAPPNPLERQPIVQVLHTGVAVIDIITPIGRGQRLGIFAGAGVGKSTLLGMLARFSESEVNIIALLGERGREVREFVEGELGPDGLSRSVIVVATGDVSPILRVRAALLATSLAEYFRDLGRHVLLAMDSLTRLAHALRELGLSAGEPPTTRGYPPSVFSTLPKILERAGNGAGSGTMTGIYTVLVDGDDLTEPVADTTRSILDGHLILSRRVAESERYPAVDIPASLSRVAQALTTPEHRRLERRARSVMSQYEEIKELLQVGAYQSGTDPNLDRVIQLQPVLSDFFSQSREERRGLDPSLTALKAILGPSEAPGGGEQEP